MGLLNKLFGTNMAKELKRVEPLVKKVEALEEEYRNLTDAQLQAKTPEFQARYRNGETLDDLLPEAFAACRARASASNTASRVRGFTGTVFRASSTRSGR